MTDAFDPGGAAPHDSGIFGLPYDADAARVIVVPVPFAATTSYGGGAERGPQAVLDASKQVDLFDVDTGRPYAAGIHMLPISSTVLEWHSAARAAATRVIEAGGAGDDPDLIEAAHQVNAVSARVNAWVDATVQEQLERGKMVATLGGDHSTPYGAIRAVAGKFPGIGILHVDAHADLRVAYEGFTHSHASIMNNVTTTIPGVARIVQVGIRDLSEDEFAAIENSGGRIRTHFDSVLARNAFEGEPWSKQIARIVEDLPERVYVSFDIDGLDPTLCPHTGTPVAGGLSFQQAASLIAGVARSGRHIVAIDVNEVAPGPDGDEWDGNVGARVLYKLIGWMLISNGIGSAR